MRRNTAISIFLFLFLFAVSRIFMSMYPNAFSYSSGVGTSQEAAAIYTVVPQEPVTLYTEPDDGLEPVISQIQSASKTVDLVMYELEDQKVEDALVAAEKHGVQVRVLLNGGLYGNGSSANQSAYMYLQSMNVPVKWTPSYFALTHQKTLITDDTSALIMTFNLTPQYYVTSRDFGVLDPDIADVTSIESAFNADWSYQKEQTSNGNDLVWSPGSKNALLTMIGSAKKSVLVYNEEMSDQDIISALTAASSRGVIVEVVMTSSSNWKDAFETLTSAGVKVRTYKPTASLYIHAKMILVDGTQVFLGSENFSTSSLDKNRELGLFISTPQVLSSLENTFSTDWYKATPFEN